MNKIGLWMMIVGLAPVSVSGQLVQRSEVGVGLGAFTYVGDLSRSYNLAHSGPAATVLYRLNLGKAVSLKAALTAGMITARDGDTDDAFGRQRNASFELFLLEGSATFEYHFLNWRGSDRRVRVNPYLFAGVGLFGISDVESKNAEYSNVQFNIPLGAGIKYILNPNFYLALELGYRQTFFDYLDNLSGGDVSTKNYQYGDAYDYDGYFFLGLSLNYTLYEIPCASTPYK